MARSLIDMVALALFASDGMKLASRDVSLEESWDNYPQLHVRYRERALVFIEVMGSQMTALADAEIAVLDAERG